VRRARALSAARLQEAVARGVAALRMAAEAVSRLSLFSSNEAADDVATGDLKYLLVPFYLAEARCR
jgi:immunoglobulin-binding protein 1